MVAKDQLVRFMNELLNGIKVRVEYITVRIM